MSTRMRAGRRQRLHRPACDVEADAVIGEHGAVIDAGCFIGRGAKIGADTHLFANVTFHAGC